MKNGSDYYLGRKADLFARFRQHADEWYPLLVELGDGTNPNAIIDDACHNFEDIIPRLPYIGGDNHPWTGIVMRAGVFLALYRAMKAQGFQASDTGKLLYDAAEARAPKPWVPASTDNILTEEQLMDRRRDRAQESQNRTFSDGYVFAFVEGDGEAFDYGYDFTECATHKLFLAEGAPELSPYFCFLDFPRSRKTPQGMMRTQELSTDASYCNHRFKYGYVSDQRWPPPFLRNTDG